MKFLAGFWKPNAGSSLFSQHSRSLLRRQKYWQDGPRTFNLLLDGPEPPQAQ